MDVLIQVRFPSNLILNVSFGEWTEALNGAKRSLSIMIEMAFEGKTANATGL